MTRRLARTTLALALLTGAVAIAAAPVDAEVSITVAPAIVTLDGGAGGVGEVAISITNAGDEPFALDTGVAVLQDMEGERSAVAWTAVRPSQLRLEPGATRSATVRITIPEGIDSGGRYAAVTFTTAEPAREEQVAAIAGRVSVPLLLAVRGEGRLVRDPIVERFAPFIEADGRLGFRAQVRNDGNVHARVAGAVQVATPDEPAIASLDFPERILLPGTSRVLVSHGTLPLMAQARLDATATFGPSADAEASDQEAATTAAGFDLLPQLTVTSAEACENLDRGPGIGATLDNRGSIGLLPVVRFEVLDASGALIGSATPVEQPLAWPGEPILVSAQLAERLLSGSYTLRATATYGAGMTLESTTPFSIGGDPATAAPLCPVLGPVAPVPAPGSDAAQPSPAEPA